MFNITKVPSDITSPVNFSSIVYVNITPQTLVSQIKSKKKKLKLKKKFPVSNTLVFHVENITKK